MLAEQAQATLHQRGDNWQSYLIVAHKPVIQRMGYTPYQSVPIVLAGNASTCLDLDRRTGGRSKRVLESLRPLVSRSG